MPSLNTKLASAPNTTANYVLKATSSTTIGNSLIFDNGTNVGIGATTINSATILAIAGSNTVTDARGMLSVNTTNAYGADLGGSISLGGENGSGSTPYPFGKISGRKEGGGAAYSGYLSFATTFSDGTITERMRITSSGIVQIGSGTFTDANGGLGLKGSGGSPYISWHADNGTRLGYIQMQTSGITSFAANSPGQALAFEVNGEERLRIASNGGLTSTCGAGGTNSQVFINSNVSNPYGPWFRFNADPNNATNYYWVASAVVSGSETVRAKLFSNGGLANYSGNNVNLASDIRLKKDIIPLSYEWNKLKQIEVVNFRYKDSNEETALFGAIAQQVQEVYPELVIVTREATETEPEYYGLREQPFQWITTKVLQEAMAKIEQLETQVEAQQQQINQLINK